MSKYPGVGLQVEELNIEEQLSQASTNQDAPIDQRKKVWCWRKKATKLNLYILETLQWGITTLQKQKSFKARHGKNIAKGPMSAAYWANKVYWAGPSGSKKSPPKSQKYRKG